MRKTSRGRERKIERKVERELKLGNIGEQFRRVYFTNEREKGKFENIEFLIEKVYSLENAGSNVTRGATIFYLPPLPFPIQGNGFDVENQKSTNSIF